MSSNLLWHSCSDGHETDSNSFNTAIVFSIEWNLFLYSYIQFRAAVHLHEIVTDWNKINQFTAICEIIFWQTVFVIYKKKNFESRLRRKSFGYTCLEAITAIVSEFMRINNNRVKNRIMHLGESITDTSQLANKPSKFFVYQFETVLRCWIKLTVVSQYNKFLLFKAM